MSKILVLYYSSYGHIERMAEAVAEGARSAGADVAVKRVPELVPTEIPDSVRRVLADCVIDAGPDGPAIEPWWGEPGDVSEVAFTLAEQADGRVRLTLVHRALKLSDGMLATGEPAPQSCEGSFSV